MIFGIKEMKEFASNHEDPRVVAIWLRLEEVRSKTSKWCNRLAELQAENEKLRDLLKRMYNNIDLWSFGEEVAEAIGPLPGGE